MSKRKREDDEGDEAGGREQLRSKARFEAHFGKSITDLAAALKLARGFERQKLGRRQKQASAEPHLLLRRREEVIVLKQLDLQKTAKNYLIKYLTKIKRVRESPVFVSVFGSAPRTDAPKSEAEANVCARLFKSAQVKEAMDKIVDLTYKNLALQPSTTSGTESRANKSTKKRDRALKPTEISVENENSTSDGMISDDVEAYNGRIAQSHEEPSDDFASFGSESISRSASPVSEDGRPSATAFLPSLGMSGYYSGSDSDDDEEDVAELRPRKNRRGQRARQQLAELKFGRNAKHLQNQPAEKGRSTGWDAKRGAIDGADRHHIKGRPTRRTDNGERHQRGNSPQTSGEPQKPKTRDDAGPLHPSWQAAKQRKQQSSAQVAFAGKKVTFD